MAVDLGERQELVRSYVKRVGFTFPTLLDEDKQVGALYGATATPTRFIIDGKGNVVAMGIGPQDWFSEEARGLIGSFLERAAADGPER